MADGQISGQAACQDEIAYSGRMEDHWVMEHPPLRPAPPASSALT